MIGQIVKSVDYENLSSFFNEAIDYICGMKLGKRSLKQRKLIELKAIRVRDMVIYPLNSYQKNDLKCSCGQLTHFIILVETDLEAEDIDCVTALSMTRIMGFLKFYEGLGKDPNSVYNRAKHFLQLIKYAITIADGNKVPLRSLQQFSFLKYNGRMLRDYSQMMRTRKIVMLNGELGVSIHRIRNGTFLSVFIFIFFYFQPWQLKMVYLEAFIACFKIMHKIESGLIRVDKFIVFKYEKALIVLILISTCGCRPQVVRTVTMDVSYIKHNR